MMDHAATSCLSSRKTLRRDSTIIDVMLSIGYVRYVISHNRITHIGISPTKAMRVDRAHRRVGGEGSERRGEGNDMPERDSDRSGRKTKERYIYSGGLVSQFIRLFLGPLFL